MQNKKEFCKENLLPSCLLSDNSSSDDKNFDNLSNQEENYEKNSKKDVSNNCFYLIIVS